MNELHRQTYLSALGIESYMPRWHLPSAPESIACVLPVELDNSQITLSSQPIEPFSQFPIAKTPVNFDSATALEALTNLEVRQKSSNQINAAFILQQFEAKKATVIAPFSLSLWRVESGFLIIDSRDTRTALPTELLLSNILRVFSRLTKPVLKEEVLRWPMIENRFVSRTEVDARNELQTWLAVENELRPISRLWLMGESASKFFIPADLSVVEKRWKKVPVDGLIAENPVEALLLPSLNELLQNPSYKFFLWSALD